jgi:hypothetical protein
MTLSRLSGIAHQLFAVGVPLQRFAPLLDHTARGPLERCTPSNSLALLNFLVIYARPGGSAAMKGIVLATLAIDTETGEIDPKAPFMGEQPAARTRYSRPHEDEPGVIEQFRPGGSIRSRVG